jgi:mRNA-degrading endonuclease toxin of MazEF toxin-antitoxin module
MPVIKPVYEADLRTGRRPVIVVSREDLNRGNNALVVLCTSTHSIGYLIDSDCEPN